MSKITDFKFTFESIEFSVAVVTAEQWSEQHLDSDNIRPVFLVRVDGSLDYERSQEIRKTSAEHRYQGP